MTIRYENLLLEPNTIIQELSWFMNLDPDNFQRKVPNIIEENIPGFVKKDRATSRLIAEDVGIKEVHLNKLILFWTLRSWKNLQKYETNVFDRFKNYTSLVKLGYDRTIDDEYKLPSPYEKLISKFEKKYDLDRYASEYKLSYASRLIRYFANL